MKPKQKTLGFFTGLCQKEKQASGGYQRAKKNPVKRHSPRRRRDNNGPEGIFRQRSSVVIIPRIGRTKIQPSGSVEISQWMAFER